MKLQSTSKNMETSRTSLLEVDSQNTDEDRKRENCLNINDYKTIALNFIRLIIVSVTIGAICPFLPIGTDDDDIELTGKHNRQKRELPLVWRQVIEASDTDCQKDATDVFPSNFLDDAASTNGGFVLNLLIAAYCMCCIAQLADNYFVPSIEKITESLGMSSHAAGASFMAVGVSVPEVLFSTLEAVRIHSDSGLSVIHSTVTFKHLVTIGAVGCLAGYVIPLSQYPLVRDSFFYIDAVLVLILFIQGDGTLNLVEIGLMLVTYAAYIIVIVFDKRLENRFKEVRFGRAYGKTDAVTANQMLNEGELERRVTMCQRRISSHLVAGHTVDIGELKSTEHDLENMGMGENTAVEYLKAVGDVTHWSKTPTVRNTPNVGSLTNLKEVNDAPVNDDGDNWNKNTTVEMDYVEKTDLIQRGSKRKSTITTKPLQKPESLGQKVMWWITLPAACFHILLIPDPRKVNTWQERLFPLTFILSTLMISVYTFVVIWMLALFGNSVFIPDKITLDTLIAAGLAFPGIYISVCLARDGYADMAVANAMGSNIFGIFFGVPVPFIANGGALTNNDHKELEHILMLACVATLHLLVMLMVWWSGLTLDRNTGLATLGLFVVMLVYSVLSQVNGLLFVPGLPKCKPSHL